MRIGVGMLKRTDQKAYGSFRLRPVADHGKWSVKRKVDSIEMSDGSSGFGYEYRKTQVSNHTFLVFLLVTRTTRQVAPYGKDPKQTNAKRPPRERVSSNGDSGKYVVLGG